jgi:hypothetical protein
MKNLSCHDVEELLAAYAAGEPDELVERHIETCRACRDEVGAIGALLSETRAAAEPRPAKDEAFWRDFERSVARACDAEAPRPSMWAGILAWLRKPLVVGGFCATAAAIILFAGLSMKNPGDLARAPMIGGSTPGEVPKKHHQPRPVHVISHEELDYDVENLSADQLNTVLHSFDGAEDDTLDEDSLAVRSGGAVTAETIENLSDEELARVYQAL